MANLWNLAVTTCASLILGCGARTYLSDNPGDANGSTNTGGSFYGSTGGYNYGNTGGYVYGNTGGYIYGNTGILK